MAQEHRYLAWLKQVAKRVLCTEHDAKRCLVQPWLNKYDGDGHRVNTIKLASPYDHRQVRPLQQRRRIA
jgi:hypothetical protein